MRRAACVAALLLVMGADVVARADPPKPASGAGARPAAKPAAGSPKPAAVEHPPAKADPHAKPGAPQPHEPAAKRAPVSPKPAARAAHTAPAKADKPAAVPGAKPVVAPPKPVVAAAAPAPVPEKPPVTRDPADLERIARAIAAAVAADPQTARAAMAARAAARAAADGAGAAGAVDAHAAANAPARLRRRVPPPPPLRRVPLRWPETLTRWEVPWPDEATGFLALAWPEPVPEPLDRRPVLDALALGRARPAAAFVVHPSSPGRPLTIVRPASPLERHEDVAVTQSH